MSDSPQEPMTRKQLRALQRQQEENGEPITEFVPVPPAVAPQPAPTFTATPVPPVSQFVPPTVAPAAPKPESTEVKSSEADAKPADPEALFRIPTNLTGEIATASIVIENPTSPLDVLAAAATGSIPIKTGSIDVQLPESRVSVTAPAASEPDTDTGSIAQVITPLKSQSIAISGELGHQRRLNIKPIDSQKYWVLGTGIFMVTVGAGVLLAYLLGYLN